MRILLVDDDDALLSFIAEELENRGCDVHQSSSGDEALRVWQRLGPWELVLTDYRFFPGTKIRDGVQLAAAIDGINPCQQMAIMSASQKEAREKRPEDLSHLPVLRKPFRMEQVLLLLRQPVLPL
jgi:CheY-like chemotaxis protein